MCIVILFCVEYGKNAVGMPVGSRSVSFGRAAAQRVKIVAFFCFVLFCFVVFGCCHS